MGLKRAAALGMTGIAASSALMVAAPAVAVPVIIDPETGNPIPEDHFIAPSDQNYESARNAFKRSSEFIESIRNADTTVNTSVARSSSSARVALGDSLTVTVELTGTPGTRFDFAEGLSDVLSHNSGSVLTEFSSDQASDAVAPTLSLSSSSLQATGTFGASGRFSFSYVVLIDVEEDAEITAEVCGSGSRTFHLDGTRAPFREIWVDGELYVYFQGSGWPQLITDFFGDEDDRIFTSPRTCVSMAIPIGMPAPPVDPGSGTPAPPAPSAPAAPSEVVVATAAQAAPAAELAQTGATDPAWSAAAAGGLLALAGAGVLAARSRRSAERAATGLES